jgi:hypothetical protein
LGEKGKKDALVREFKVRKGKEEEIKRIKEDENRKNKEEIIANNDKLR